MSATPAAHKACAAIQINRRAEDFTCAKHQASVHVHVRPDGSQVRWAESAVPRGMRRKRPYKKYANPKLLRHALNRGGRR